MTQEPPIPKELWERVPAEVQAALLAVFARLERRIADLEAQLRQNSTNSSKPPSSDPPAVKRAPPKPGSGKKPGAQPGHPRALRPLREPTHVVPCKPTCCPACAAPLRGDDPDPERFQVTELPPLKPIVTEYQRHRLTCRRCGLSARGALPAGVRGQDGPDLQAAVVYLVAECRLSKRKAAQVCRDLFGIPISPGQVCATQDEVARALAPVVDESHEYVRTQPVHLDETGWKQAGRRSWLWAAVTALASLFVIRRSRGGAVVDELLGPGHARVVTTDRWGAYEGIPWQRRQLCWAHLRRDFQAMIDRNNSGAPVGRALLAASDELFHWWHRKRDGTCSARACRRELTALRERLILLLGRGVRCRCAETSATCGELEKEEMLWTFLDQEGVEPTNNAAERALRHAVQWRKASYGTASASGSQFVATILSVLMTCRQQGKNLWEYLRACCRAAQDRRQPPSLLPEAVNA